MNKLFSENHAIDETMWKNMVAPDDNTIRCIEVRSACQITTALTEDTHKIIFNTYYCSEQYEIFSSLTMMHIHGNNKYFYIVDSHIYANNNKK